MGHKVLILGEKESFIIKILVKKLGDSGIESVFSTYDEGKIKELWDEISVITFCEEDGKDLPVEVKAFVENNLGNRRIIPLQKPIDYEAYIASINSDDSQDSAGDKKKILIVDDDPNYMSLVREWMVNDYKVSMVTSGARAIKWLGSNKADLVLLDYEMPVTSGLEVLETLRANDEMKELPVIFLSGNDSQESIRSVEHLNHQGYFLKTMPKDEFLNKIKVFFMQEAE